MAAEANMKTFQVKMNKLYGAGIQSELLTVVGDIQPWIAKIAMQYGADLIITGTHARTGLNLLFKGSIAESIIHHSTIPVCVVPMDK